eukprot:1120977-Pelagomonas_calceolata.AAC.7
MRPACGWLSLTYFRGACQHVHINWHGMSECVCVSGGRVQEEEERAGQQQSKYARGIISGNQSHGMFRCCFGCIISSA